MKILVIEDREPWKSHEPDWKPPEGAVIHARLNRDEREATLCEQDGPLLPWGSVAVDLSHPKTTAADVTCSACLAWMRA